MRSDDVNGLNLLQRIRCTLATLAIVATALGGIATVGAPGLVHAQSLEQVAGSDTRTLVSPRTYGRGNQSRAWYNRSADRWDGVIPRFDILAQFSNTDHAITYDLVATPVFTPQLPSRLDTARPDVAWNEDTGLLHVLASDSESTRLDRYRYDPLLDVYLHERQSMVAGLRHPGGPDGGEFPASLQAGSDGSLWVGVMREGALDVQYSRDGGDSWLSEPVTLDDNVRVGLTAWASFERDGAARLGVFAAEDASDGGSRYYYWTISESADPADPAGWTDQSASIPAFEGAAQADEDLSAVADSSGNQYFVTRTAGGDSGDAQLQVLRRTPTGGWRAYTLREFGGGNEFGRPAAVIDESSRVLYVFVGTGGFFQVPLSEIATLQGPAFYTPLLSGPSLRFSDAFTPREPVSVRSGLLLLVHDRAGQTLWRTLTSINPPFRAPAVLGLSQADARRVLVDADLSIGSIGVMTDASVADGTVLGQDPAPGGSFEDERSVNLVLSADPVRVSVPDLVGGTPAAAGAELTDLGLALGAQRLVARAGAVGSIIGQAPAAGDAVLRGTAVDVDVVADAAARAVPEVEGLSIGAASSALADAGLAIRRGAELRRDGVVPGSVVKQQPAAGVLLAPGAAVTVVVAAGPLRGLLPDVTGLAELDAQVALNDAGWFAGLVTTTFSPSVTEGRVISQDPAPGNPRRALDRFDSNRYDNDDGTLPWSGPWVEQADPDAGAGAGRVSVRDGELRLHDSPDSGGKPSVSRGVDLAGATRATLRFEYSVSEAVNTNDFATVEFSQDDGLFWNVLETFGGDEGRPPGPREYDVTEFASARSRVRFRVAANFGGRGEYFAIPAVEIVLGNAAPPDVALGTAVDLLVSQGAPFDPDPDDPTLVSAIEPSYTRNFVPANAYGSPNQSRHWVNPETFRFDGLVPRRSYAAEFPATTHLIAKGVGGGGSPTDTELATPRDSSPDVAWEDATQQLYIYAQPSFWRFDYDAGTDTYVGAESIGQVPGMAEASLDAAPSLEARGARVWIASGEGDALLVQFSDDAGRRWLDAPVMLAAGPVGMTDWSSFETSEGAFVGVFAIEPETPSGFSYRYIATEGNPAALSAWVDESARIPVAPGGGEPAGSVSATRDAAGNQYFAVEFAGGGPDDPRVQVFRRSVLGQWSAFVVSRMQDMPVRARPSVVTDELSGRLYVFTGDRLTDPAANGDAGFVRARLDDLAALEEAVFVPVFQRVGRAFGDVARPRGTPAGNGPVLIALAHGPGPVADLWLGDVFTEGGIVPDIVGLTLAAAEQALADEDLFVGAVAERDAPGIPAGTVIEQTPGPASQLFPDNPVKVTVASGGGMETVDVPDLVGLDLDAATARLDGAGLALGPVSEAPSNDLAAGQIVSQVPVAGLAVPAGATVDLVVSSGPAAGRRLVPDLRGLTEAEGRDAIAAAGLRVGRVTADFDPAAAAGTVLSQHPPASGAVADSFSRRSFDNDDGDIAWTNAWLESDALGDGPLKGNAKVRGGRLWLDDAPDTGDGPWVAREADLSAYRTARLQLSAKTLSGVDLDDVAVVEMSADGGKRWSVVYTFTDIDGKERRFIDIDVSKFISGQTRVRLRIAHKYGGKDEKFGVTYLALDVSGAELPAGAPVDFVMSLGAR